MDGGSGAPAKARALTLAPLVAATYFMVAGGPYGLEELVAGAGYGGALLILVVTPLVWSLPTALMVGELASAIPEEGGYYAWVKRALGPFWGFQEVWLSLVASIFDMAIYPTLFTLYLGKLWPTLGGEHAILTGTVMIALCAAWNVRGARSVGRGALTMTVALLAPFLVMAVLALFGHATTILPASAPIASDASAPAGAGGLLAGILIAMWNYMGWDNASTIAGEVDRPQHTYPRAMLAAVVLVGLTYVIPVAAVARTGIDPSAWTTGAWADVGEALGGHWLRVAIVAGGAICGVGMFNALVLSYSRLPLVMAEDGLLPRAFAWVTPRSGAPWVSIIVCSVAWAACLRLGFDRLIELDILIYQVSLLLEFGALVALRLKEPDLPRPYRVPGGLVGAVALGLGPLALCAVALYKGRDERVGPISVLTLGALIMAAGPVAYLGARRLFSRPGRRAPVAAPGDLA